MFANEYKHNIRTYIIMALLFRLTGNLLAGNLMPLNVITANDKKQMYIKTLSFDIELQGKNLTLPISFHLFTVRRKVTSCSRDWSCIIRKVILWKVQECILIKIVKRF